MKSLDRFAKQRVRVVLDGGAIYEGVLMGTTTSRFFLDHLAILNKDGSPKANPKYGGRWFHSIRIATIAPVAQQAEQRITPV